MVDIIATNNRIVIVGIGVTGLSVARFLASRGEQFVMVDNRLDPPQLQALSAEMPDVIVELGDFNPETFCAAKQIIVSPGVGLSHPAIDAAWQQGVAISGDIQLFADNALAPLALVSGSNGKSTVVTLLGEMAKAAGLQVGVGGNLGTPALDLLDERCELYVLELSSFQLELVENLNGQVATVLNMSPDHMDRYSGMTDYHRAKHRIFRGVKQVVCNRDDALSSPLVSGGVKHWTFGVDAPDFHGFGVKLHNGQAHLYFENTPLLAVEELAIKGRHNLANALAALALGHALGLPFAAMIKSLKVFKGLAHRCQTVATIKDVTWINDSKATNVGAAVAAIDGLSSNAVCAKREAGQWPSIILIAGGQAKDQAFSELAKAALGRVKLAILLGEDAGLLAESLSPDVPVLYATSMESAVNAGAKAAQSGDKVLLSPACASFDMFKSFEHRGDEFASAVRALA